MPSIWLKCSTACYVARLTDDYSFDKTIFYNEHFRLAGVPILGNIFNNVSRTLLDKTRGIYTPILEDAGFPVLGVIPQKAEIAAPTVREYYDTLGGELLVGDENKMMHLVEEVVIGSMTIEGALSYLRRAPNKAVITGGDRSDIAITALETSTSVLILTGGLYPDVSVISKATEKNVPVILVHYDTYTAIERMHEVSRRIHPSDTKAVQIPKITSTNSAAGSPLWSISSRKISRSSLGKDGVKSDSVFFSVYALSAVQRRKRAISSPYSR